MAGAGDVDAPRGAPDAPGKVVVSTTHDPATPYQAGVNLARQLGAPLITTRLRFVNTVYIPAMRNPYSAAKAIGTAAVLASGRVELGIVVGWCREEFALMGERFEARGKRTDEIIDLMRALWRPAVGRLRELRAENGLSMDDFTVLTPLTDAFTTADYQRAADAGITAHHHHAVDVLCRSGRFVGRHDRRHAALPQGFGARRLSVASFLAATRPGLSPKRGNE